MGNTTANPPIATPPPVAPTAPIDVTPFVNNIQGAIGMFKSAGSPPESLPDLQKAITSNYNKIAPTGYFAQGDGQQLGHILRGQWGIQDPTQGGTVAANAPAPQIAPAPTTIPNDGKTFNLAGDVSPIFGSGTPQQALNQVNISTPGPTLGPNAPQGSSSQNLISQYVAEGNGGVRGQAYRQRMVAQGFISDPQSQVPVTGIPRVPPSFQAPVAQMTADHRGVFDKAIDAVTDPITNWLTGLQESEQAAANPKPAQTPFPSESYAQKLADTQAGNQPNDPITTAVKGFMAKYSLHPSAVAGLLTGFATVPGQVVREGGDLLTGNSPEVVKDAHGLLNTASGLVAPYLSLTDAPAIEMAAEHVANGDKQGAVKILSGVPGAIGQFADNNKLETVVSLIPFLHHVVAGSAALGAEHGDMAVDNATATPYVNRPGDAEFVQKHLAANPAATPETVAPLLRTTPQHAAVLMQEARGDTPSAEVPTPSEPTGPVVQAAGKPTPTPPPSIYDQAWHGDFKPGPALPTPAKYTFDESVGAGQGADDAKLIANRLTDLGYTATPHSDGVTTNAPELGFRALENPFAVQQEIGDATGVPSVENAAPTPTPTQNAPTSALANMRELAPEEIRVATGDQELDFVYSKSIPGLGGHVVGEGDIQQGKNDSLPAWKIETPLGKTELLLKSDVGRAAGERVPDNATPTLNQPTPIRSGDDVTAALLAHGQDIRPIEAEHAGTVAQALAETMTAQHPELYPTTQDAFQKIGASIVPGSEGLVGEREAGTPPIGDSNGMLFQKGEHPWITAAKQQFGTTQDPRETGYITPSGEMLDFSGKSDSADYKNGQLIRGRIDYLGGRRGLDHRDIWQAMPDDPDSGDTTGMMKFMSETGAARVGQYDGNATVHITHPLTPQQIGQFAKFDTRDSLSAEASRPDGKTAYSKGIDSPSRAQTMRLLREASASVAKPTDTLFQRNPQTETPEFKRFFQGSKVVNEDGSPKVVYHGTGGAPFDAFNTRRSVANNRMGAYFSESPDGANEFSRARGRTVPAYLNIKKPFDVTGVPREDITKAAGYSSDIQHEIRPQGRSGAYSTLEWLDAKHGLVPRLKRMGYDGIRFNGDNEGVTHVAFDPTQIKSAIGNRGTFDPNDPNILHQQANGAVQFAKDSSAIVHLFKSANISTFLHEVIHVIARNALSPEDISTLESWRNKPMSDWTEEDHELLARTWERWLYNGATRAIEKLVPAFKVIKEAMVRIYGKISADSDHPLNVNVSPQISRWFETKLGADLNRVRGEDTPKEVSERSRATEPQPDAEKYARPGSINLNRLNIPDEAKQKIRDASDQLTAGVKLTRSQAREAANALNMTPQMLASHPVGEIPPGIHPAIWQTAARNLNVTLAKQLHDAEAEQIASPTPENEAHIGTLRSELQDTTERTSPLARVSGQTLSHLNIDAEPYEEALQNARDREQELANAPKVDDIVKPQPRTLKRTATGKQFGQANKVFTADKMAEATKRLNDKLSGVHADPLLGLGTIARVLPELTEIGGYYLEGGLRQFGDWAAEMRKHFPLTDAQTHQVYANVRAEAAKRLAPEHKIILQNNLVDKLAPTMGREGVKDFINELAENPDHPELLDKLVSGKPLNPAEEKVISDAGLNHQLLRAKGAPSTGAVKTVRDIMNATKAEQRKAALGAPIHSVAIMNKILSDARADAAKTSRVVKTIDPFERSMKASLRGNYDEFQSRIAANPDLKAATDAIRNGTETDADKRLFAQHVDLLNPPRTAVRSELSKRLAKIMRDARAGRVGYPDAKAAVQAALTKNLETSPEKLPAAIKDLAAVKDDDFHALANVYNKHNPVAWSDRAAYVLRAGLLSGPRTAESIAISHALGSGFEEGVVRPVAAALGKGSVQGASPKASLAAGKAMIRSIPDAGRLLKEGVTATQLRGMQPGYRTDIEHNGQLASEPVKSAPTRFFARVHPAIFHVFGEGLRERGLQEFSALKAREKGGDADQYRNDADVRELAEKYKAEQLYTNRNQLADAVHGLGRGRPAVRLATAIQSPFVTVPLNLVGRGAEYSGAGLATGGLTRLRSELADFVPPKVQAKFFGDIAKMTPEERVALNRKSAYQMSRGITGVAALGALGYYLTSKGILNPPNTKGYEYGSINFHGKEYGISRLQPVATPISYGGEIYQYVHGKDYDFLAPVSDNPYSQVLEKANLVQDAVQNPKNLPKDMAKLAGSYLSMLVPTIMSQFASSVDPAGVVRLKRGALDYVMNRIYGARERLKPSIYPEANNYKSTGWPSVFNPLRVSLPEAPHSESSYGGAHSGHGSEGGRRGGAR